MTLHFLSIVTVSIFSRLFVFCFFNWWCYHAHLLPLGIICKKLDRFWKQDKKCFIILFHSKSWFFTNLDLYFLGCYLIRDFSTLEKQQGVYQIFMIGSVFLRTYFDRETQIDVSRFYVSLFRTWKLKQTILDSRMCNFLS